MFINFYIVCFIVFTGDLHSSIQAYIAANLTSKIVLHATPRREGLIRARMFGAKKATGQVVSNNYCLLAE